jgi:hypothetical protein
MYKETHITDFRVTKFREKRQQDALQRLENKVFIVGNNIWDCCSSIIYVYITPQNSFVVSIIIMSS